jgi:hypothetical protein
MATLGDPLASDHSGSDLKVEKGDLHVEERSVPLGLDKRGLPLIPQPSDHKEDPLIWRVWQKYYIVLLMSAFTLMAQLGTAILNPSFVLVAKNLHVTVEEASYSTTVFHPLLRSLPPSYYALRQRIREKASLSYLHARRHCRLCRFRSGTNLGRVDCRVRFQRHRVQYPTGNWRCYYL